MRSVTVTLSLPEDVVDFLDGLARVRAGYGRSRTEAAALLIRDEMLRILRTGDVERLEASMKRVRELATSSSPDSA